MEINNVIIQVESHMYYVVNEKAIMVWIHTWKK